MNNPIKCGLMLPTHAPREEPVDAGLIGATAEWAEARGFNARETAIARALELNLGFPKEWEMPMNDEQHKRLALAGTPEDVVARMQEYIDPGCTTFTVSPIEKVNSAYQSQVRWFAHEVLPRLKPAMAGTK